MLVSVSFFFGFTHDGLLVIFSFVLVELVGAVELVDAVGRRRLHILEDRAHPWVRHLPMMLLEKASKRRCQYLSMLEVEHLERWKDTWSCLGCHCSDLCFEQLGPDCI